MLSRALTLSALVGGVLSIPIEKRACPNIHVFGARETTVSQGYGSSITVVNDVLNAYSGSTAEAIVYPACGGQSSCGGISYSSSVAQGIAAVASAVNSFNSQCPNTEIVLVGYSQGGEIMDVALCGGGDPNQGYSNTAVQLSASALSMVKAAIFMGDPLFRAGLSYEVGTCTAGGFDERPAGFSCPSASLIQSYCDASDPYCCNGNNAATHQGYGAEYGNQALAFIKSKLSGGGTSSPGNGTSPGGGTGGGTVAQWGQCGGQGWTGATACKYERQVSGAGTQSQALEAAIAAAENYMRALKLADTPWEKQYLDSKCKDWISRAEKIKLDKSWKPIAPQAGNRSLKEPISKRKLSTREEIILLESAKLNGFLFPPWKNDPNPQEFELVGNEGQFEDKPLRLSAPQKEVFNGWKRPSELVKERIRGSITADAPKRADTKVIMDLVQDITTDCSVIASICAATARFERGHGCLFYKAIFPFDYIKNIPHNSTSGKYIFRLYFNGCYRKVVIDDRLPSSKTTRSLFAFDRNSPESFWPALIEKAYLKLRGGYDFPGSNSGTDLWVLTGWIPEQIFLHHEDVAPDQLWRRISGAFQYGDVVLTLGTGELNSREERLQGLIGRHDYAVLDLTESDGYRQLLIKNPWADSSSRTPQSYSRASEQSALDTNSTPLLPGSFWMDYDQIFQNFDNMYLNWNPGLFTNRQDIHFTWDLSKTRFNSTCFANSPQFSISTVAGGPVWLLLSKHFRTASTKASNAESGFISIYISKKGGQRIFISDDAFYRGPFVDSPNTLAKINMEANSTYTVVVAEQSLPLVPQNFTLSAFSRNEMVLKPAEDKFLHTYQMESEWSPITAGGNTESPRYSSNPQHNLQLSETADVLILLETSESELAIHAKLFWSNGKRISTVKKRDIVTDSGHYRPGCVVAETEQLRAGSYTLVCSTFLPDQVAKFNIWVFSTKKCHVKALPSEAAGRLAVLSDVGILPPGIDRIFAPLNVSRLTRLKLIARSRNSTIGTRHVTSSPMLLTVELGQGPYKEVLASSENGEFSDAVSGIRVPDFDVRPEYAEKGGVWIVIERIGGPVGQVTDCVDVEALGEERVEIGEWITS